jgi:phosphatidylserine decarboxylase
MTQYERPQNIGDFLEQLNRWYKENYQGFRTMYDEAIEHLVRFPSDTPKYYQHRWEEPEEDSNIKRLCDFFDNWYKLYDDPRLYTHGSKNYDHSSGIYHGLDYIVRFSWLSYENMYGMVFVTSGPGRQMTDDFTWLQGQQMNDPKSKELAAVWEKEIGEEKMKDFIRPKGGYATVNDFFARELKDADKSRPVAVDKDGSVVVAASADCVINMIVDQLTETTPIPVKTVTMNVKELLRDSEYADKFVGGTAVSCILMPDMYHWYHAPVAGTVVESRDDKVDNDLYYGMQDFPGLLNKGNVGYGYDYSMFEDFRRGYLIIDTGNEDYGYVGMVPVGLNSIGTVQFEEKIKKPNATVKKGERIGKFLYGGSLNILLFEPGVFPALQLLQGQRIGYLEKKNSPRTLGIFSSLWRRPSRRDRF